MEGEAYGGLSGGNKDKLFYLLSSAEEEKS